MTTSRKTQDSFFYFTGLCAIAVYGFIIYQHAYNIPKWDDFPDILQFMDRWLDAKTIFEKFLVFKSQTNEHILLVNHFIILCQYYFIGHINFTWLIFIGNIFYLGSALTLWLFFKDHTEHAFCFAIIMLTGVTFYSYESTLWAMTAISNQAVICFSFLALYIVIVSRQTRSIPLAMLLAFLAVFSQSNGLLVLVVIGGYFYFSKAWLQLKYWSIFSALTIGLYAYWFNPASQQELHLVSILHQLPLRNYFLTLPTFLAYFGASITTKITPATILLALFIGIGIFSIAILQLKRKLYSIEMLLVITLLLLNILSIAAYRGLIGGPQVAFISRYKMYACYFLAVCVLLSPVFLLKLQESVKWKSSILLISLLYFAISFPGNLAQAKIIDGDLYHSLQYWIEDGDLRRARGYFIKDTDSYLFAALKKKTYTPMILLPQEKIIKKVNPLSTCPEIINQAIPVTENILISHKNPNAAGIKVTSSRQDAPVTVILCAIATQQFYQFEIPASEESTTFFVAREFILPGTYNVAFKQGDLVYQSKAPFINKVATR